MADDQSRPLHVIVDSVAQPVAIDLVNKPVDVNVVKCVPVAVQPVLPPQIFATGSVVHFISPTPPSGVSTGKVQQVVGEWIAVLLDGGNAGLAGWIGPNVVWVHGPSAVWF